MPQYATIGSHPAADCPLANKAVREFIKGMAPKWPELEKQLNVKSLTWLHLDTNHKSFQLFEAPTAEAVRDFLYQSGQAHFLELDFHLVTPIEELLGMMEQLPTMH